MHRFTGAIRSFVRFIKSGPFGRSSEPFQHDSHARAIAGEE